MQIAGRIGKRTSGTIAAVRSLIEEPVAMVAEKSSSGTIANYSHISPVGGNEPLLISGTP